MFAAQNIVFFPVALPLNMRYYRIAVCFPPSGTSKNFSFLSKKFFPRIGFSCGFGGVFQRDASGGSGCSRASSGAERRAATLWRGRIRKICGFTFLLPLRCDRKFFIIYYYIYCRRSALLYISGHFTAILHFCGDGVYNRGL